MPDAVTDRRKAPRYALILIATVIDEESQARLSARTSDASRTGCYVDTLNPIPQGRAVCVALSSGDEVFETRGRIVYVSAGLGMGIQFKEPMDPQQLATLDRWLERAGDLRL
jgi:hypothetical protein